MSKNVQFADFWLVGHVLQKFYKLNQGFSLSVLYKLVNIWGVQAEKMYKNVQRFLMAKKNLYIFVTFTNFYELEHPYSLVRSEAHLPFLMNQIGRTDNQLKVLNNQKECITPYPANSLQRLILGLPTGTGRSQSSYSRSGLGFGTDSILWTVPPQKGVMNKQVWIPFLY